MGMQSEKSTCVSRVRIRGLELGLDGGDRVGTGSWMKGLKSPLHFNSKKVE